MQESELFQFDAGTERPETKQLRTRSVPGNHFGTQVGPIIKKKPDV